MNFKKQISKVNFKSDFEFTVICVLITHTWYLWVCKEESQIDDARDILEEETAHDLIAKYISSFRTLSIALSVNKNTSKNLVGNHQQSSYLNLKFSHLIVTLHW